jgi:hypothetical protein
MRTRVLSTQGAFLCAALHVACMGRGREGIIFPTEEISGAALDVTD